MFATQTVKPRRPGPTYPVQRAPADARRAPRPPEHNPVWAALSVRPPTGGGTLQRTVAPDHAWGEAARLQRKDACGCGAACAHRAAGTQPEDAAPRAQFQLRVGPADDAFERQADHVADSVLGAPASSARPAITPLPAVQAAGLQATQSGVGAAAPSAAVGGYVQSLGGRGQPLPASARSFFESRLGHGFGRVRVHTDAHAQSSADALGARAYTVGSDVVFGGGEYDPTSARGRRLLAHELTHVVQQGATRPLIQRETKPKAPCAVHAYDASEPDDTAVIPSDGSGLAVTSVPDLVTKVNAYVDDDKNGCSCVARLEINGHGTDGYQSVGNGSLYVNDEKAIVHDSPDAHLNRLASIKFCNTALFMLMGCHVGQGQGKVLLSKLANLLPGKLIGGAQHYTGGTGLGKKKVTGEGDKPNQPLSKRDPFLTSRYVRWHIVIAGKEYVIPGNETETSEAKAKLRAADKIKVKTPDGVEIIK